ncbi:MAG: hypothetical protein RI967_142 [Planctomycetota bacterium]|jgi:type II secretory pathway pseudopilin PulG
MPKRSASAAVVRPRAGGILLELLLAIAIFAAAATFTLGAMRDALDGVRRAELRARALDLAATRLAEVDAGLLSIGDLGGSEVGEVAGGLDLARPGADLLSVTLSVVRDAGNATGPVLVRAVVRDASVDARPILAELERSVDAVADRRREETR